MIESKVNKELERKIDLYVNGKLSAEETDELWTELIQDEYYLDYMKSVANLKEIVDRKKAAKPASKVYSLKKVVQYGSAAAVILLAAVFGIMNYSASNELSTDPVEQIGLDVVRDGNGVPGTIENEVIRRAIRLATDGDIDEAITLLKTELAQTDDSQVKAELALSLGSILYNKGDYASSVDNFEMVIAQENVEVLTLEKGYWFLGNTYLQLDQLSQAEEAFRNAYELNGAYSRPAKTYVDALNNISR